MTEAEILALQQEVENRIDPLHAGLELARFVTASDLPRREAVFEWVQRKVESYGVEAGSKNHITLVTIGEVFDDIEDRSDYCRFLLLACLKNGGES